MKIKNYVKLAYLLCFCLCISCLISCRKDAEHDTVIVKESIPADTDPQGSNQPQTRAFSQYITLNKSMIYSGDVIIMTMSNYYADEPISYFEWRIKYRYTDSHSYHAYELYDSEIVGIFHTYDNYCHYRPNKAGYYHIECRPVYKNDWQYWWDRIDFYANPKTTGGGGGGYPTDPPLNPWQ